jgi:hypothetical protein
VRYTADGSFARPLARLPACAHYVAEIRRPGPGALLRASVRPPFASLFAYAVSGNTLFYGNADRFEIASFDTSGRVSKLIRKLDPRRAVTEQMREQYRTGRLNAAGDDPQRRREVEDQLSAVPFPDSLPAFRQFKVDREGMLWVEDYRLATAAHSRWSVFDTTGRWLANVTVPAAWQIMEIGADYILTVATNELGVERVRLHELRRAPR